MRTKFSYNRLGSAFTLVEVLTVLAIIAFLASLLIVMVPKLKERAMSRSTEATFHRITLALEQYKQDCGFYPWWLRAVYSNSAMLAGTLLNPDFGGWSSASRDWFKASDLRRIPDRSSEPLFEIVDGWNRAIDYIPWQRYGSRVSFAFLPTGSSQTTRGVWVDADDNGSYNYDQTDNPREILRYGTIYYPDGGSSNGQEDDPDDYIDVGEGGKGAPGVPAKEFFYNPTSFQLYSKGADGTTDTTTDLTEGISDEVGSFDHGLDPDDINNYEIP